MSNAQPKKSAKVIEFPLNQKEGYAYTDVIEKAQQRAEKACLTIFRANENLYGIYGPGTKVAGVLRGLNPRSDFKGLSYEELPEVYLNPKLEPLSRDAVQELVEGAAKLYAGEPIHVFNAQYEGPEALYEDEPKQVGQDI